MPGRVSLKPKRRKFSLSPSSRKLLLVGLVLSSLFLSNLPERIYAPFQMSVVSLGAPVSETVSRTSSYVASFMADLFSFGAAWEARKLRQELEEARNKILALENTLARKEAQLKSLESLSRLPAAASLEKVPAEIIRVVGAGVAAMDLSDWRRRLIIDKGAGSGLKTGMAVAWNGAVVGRLSKVGPASSVVELLTDPEFRLWILDARSRQQGIWKGSGGRECEVAYIPFDADVREGDWLLATGFEGLFPSGMVAGKISKPPVKRGHWFQQVSAVPEVDITSLESVIVIKKERVAAEMAE